MSAHGKVILVIPSSDGGTEMRAEAQFQLVDEADTKAATRLYRPMPDGTTQEIVVGVTVNILSEDQLPTLPKENS